LVVCFSIHDETFFTHFKNTGSKEYQRNPSADFHTPLPTTSKKNHERCHSLQEL
jgi:hypothetical protein